MEDIQLIALYFARDENAIRQTELKYGQKLLGFAERVLSSREDAEECVNDTLWKAWDTIPPQNPNHLGAYLMKICRFAAYGILDKRKAAKRNAEVVVLSDELMACIPANMSSMEITDEALGAILDRFIHSLKREERILFLKRYYLQEPLRQAASESGISESNAKVRLHRIRKKLKSFLQEEGVSV